MANDTAGNASEQLPSRRRTGAAIQVGSGALVLLGSRTFARLVRLVGTAALARLLTPQDFGIVVLANVTVAFFEIVSDLRVSAALIRMPVVTEQYFRTVFAIAGIRGILIAALLLVLAPALGGVMSQPALVPVLMVLAVAPLVDAMLSPRMVLFDKALDFKWDLISGLANAAAVVMVSVGTALHFRNHWSLVCGIIAGKVVTVAISYLAAPWRPSYSLSHWREVVNFGGWLTGAGLISYLNYKSDVFLIGGWLGPQTVGLYNAGNDLAGMASSEVAAPLSRALYPAMARLHDRREELRARYLEAQAVIIALTLPIGVGTALVGEEAILLLFGPKWVGSAFIVKVLAPIIALQLVTSGVGVISMVAGETRALFLREVAALCFRMPLFVAGLWLGGLQGVVWARLASGTFFLFLSLQLAARLLGDHWWRPFAAGWRSIVATAAMATVLLSTFPALASDSSNLLVARLIFFKIAVGACIYVTIHLVLWRQAGRPSGPEQRGIEYALHIKTRLRRGDRDHVQLNHE